MERLLKERSVVLKGPLSLLEIEHYRRFHRVQGRLVLTSFFFIVLGQGVNDKGVRSEEGWRGGVACRGLLIIT